MMPGSTEVPGTANGFYSQSDQALFELIRLNGPSCFVSVEVDDDVSVRRDDVIDRMIQVKAVTGRGNPASDNSPDLWKTLSNWVDKLCSGVDSNAFVYSVNCAIKDIRPGKVVGLFKDADSGSEAAAAYEKAFELLTPKTKNGGHASNFFLQNHKAEALKVIQCFSFESHRYVGEELRDLILTHRDVSPKDADAVVEELRGWVFASLKEKMGLANDATISSVEFKQELIACVRRIKDDPLCLSVPRPSDEDVACLRDEDPIFLQQLRAIGLDKDVRWMGGYKYIAEKIQSCNQIARWADRGIVTARAVEQYQDELEACCEDIELQLFPGSDDMADGCKKFAKSRIAGSQINLQGFRPPSQVCFGQLHELADVGDIDAGLPRVLWCRSFVEWARAGEGFAQS